MREESDNIGEYSVSAISDALRGTVEQYYGFVRVRGEVSGLKRAASGHVYFTLKDEKAALDAVCWRGTAGPLSPALIEGAELRCTGKITTFPGRSKYQMVISHAEPAGQGAMMALLEKRKKKLEAEGLFAEERKRPLPFLPEVIGVITSPTGAVIRDILHRLEDRFPREVILWPVAVQGEQAERHLLAAFASVEALHKAHQAADADEGTTPRVKLPDVIILARGGGSVEDLWNFNSEAVARAVSACPIPVITAIGHETDTTLVDFVADKRAPTPTGAAEIAVPRRDDLRLRLDENRERAQGASLALLQRKQDVLRETSAAVRHCRERFFAEMRAMLASARLSPATACSRYVHHKRALLRRVPYAAGHLHLYFSRRRQGLQRVSDRLRAAGPARTRAYAARLQRLPDPRASLLRCLDKQAARFAYAGKALYARATASLQRKQACADAAAARLRPGLIPLAGAKNRLGMAEERLLRAKKAYFSSLESRISQAGRILYQCSHKAILDKGYAVIRQQGAIVSSAAGYTKHAETEIEFADGKIRVS